MTNKSYRKLTLVTVLTQPFVTTGKRTHVGWFTGCNLRSQSPAQSFGDHVSSEDAALFAAINKSLQQHPCRFPGGFRLVHRQCADMEQAVRVRDFLLSENYRLLDSHLIFLGSLAFFGPASSLVFSGPVFSSVFFGPASTRTRRICF